MEISPENLGFFYGAGAALGITIASIIGFSIFSKKNNKKKLLKAKNLYTENKKIGEVYNLAKKIENSPRLFTNKAIKQEASYLVNSIEKKYLETILDEVKEKLIKKIEIEVDLRNGNIDVSFPPISSEELNKLSPTYKEHFAQY